MLLVRLHRNRIGRTVLGASRAPDAIVRDAVRDEVLAHSGRTSARQVRLVLLAEIAERRKHRVRGRLPESAEASPLHHSAQVFERLQVARPALARDDAIQNVQHAPRADPAIRALAARLVLRERKEISRDVHHAVGFVQHDEAARAHHGADAGQGLVIDGRVGERRGDASSGRAAHLDGLEPFALGDAAADLLDDPSERDAHRHLDEAAPHHLARQREDLRALAVLRADGRERPRPVPHNPRDQDERLGVVDEGGLAPEAGRAGIRRAEARRAATAFDGSHHRGFLAADERPGPFHDPQVQPELRAQDALAQDSALPAPFERLAHPPNRQRILVANVEDALGRADGVRADDHPFDDAVRVGLQEHAVHEGPRVALVAVANEILRLSRGLADAPPLLARQEPRAAAPAQAAPANLVNDLFRRPLPQAPLGGPEPAGGQVLIQVQRVNLAEPFGREVLLRAEKRRHRRVAHVQRIARDVLPRLVRQEGFEGPRNGRTRAPRHAARLEMPPNDRPRVVRLNLRVEGRRPPRHDDLNERRLVAHADAPDPLHDDRCAGVGHGLLQRLLHFAAPARHAARAQADEDLPAPGLGRRGEPPFAAAGERLLGRQKIPEHPRHEVRRHVAVCQTVNLYHRREGAAPEARHLLDRKDLVRVGVVALGDAQVPIKGVVDDARAFDVAGRPDADADQVPPHRASAELRIERRHALDPGRRNVGNRAHPFERFLGQVAVLLLDGLEDGDDGVRSAADLPDRLVHELAVEVAHSFALPMANRCFSPRT